MGGMRNCHKSLASDNPAFDVFCLCVAVTTSSRGHRDPQASGFAGGWLLHGVPENWAATICLGDGCTNRSHKLGHPRADAHGEQRAQTLFPAPLARITQTWFTVNRATPFVECGCLSEDIQCRDPAG